MPCAAEFLRILGRIHAASCPKRSREKSRRRGCGVCFFKASFHRASRSSNGTQCVGGARHKTPNYRQTSPRCPPSGCYVDARGNTPLDFQWPGLSPLCRYCAACAGESACRYSLNALLRVAANLIPRTAPINRPPPPACPLSPIPPRLCRRARHTPSFPSSSLRARPACGLCPLVRRGRR